MEAGFEPGTMPLKVQILPPLYHLCYLDSDHHVKGTYVWYSDRSSSGDNFNVCYCLHFQLPNACDVDLNHVVGNVTSGSSAVTGNVLTDRPHTISSAYEKGHQRPSLQPYTFSPPESTLTIQESDGEQATVGQRQPPPPR